MIRRLVDWCVPDKALRLARAVIADGAGYYVLANVDTNGYYIRRGPNPRSVSDTFAPVPHPLLVVDGSPSVNEIARPLRAAGR